MALGVTTARILAQVECDGGGMLTFWSVDGTFAGGEAGFTMTELAAGITGLLPVPPVYNLTAATLVSLWDAGGGTLADAATGNGVMIGVTAGAGTAGRIGFFGMNGATAGVTTTLAAGATTFDFVAVIRQ